jgi:hypothetical protein
MSAMFNTLLRTLILDDGAFQEWRERPNLFLRGIALILVVTLVAGFIVFAVDMVNSVRPVRMAEIEKQIREGFEMQERFNPSWRDMPPPVRAMMDEMMDIITSMVTEIVSADIFLPRGIGGFLGAVGRYVSAALASLGGWIFYGALVLIAVNLLGGSAKLPDFLGMVSLYVIPGLLGLLRPVPCLGAFLALLGLIWGIVVYVKAVSVASDLDLGRSVLAFFTPLIVFVVLGVVLTTLMVIWMVIVF